MSETPKRPPPRPVEDVADGYHKGDIILLLSEWIAYSDYLEREVHQYREAAIQESSHRAATETERARLEGERAELLDAHRLAVMREVAEAVRQLSTPDVYSQPTLDNIADALESGRMPI
jgi:hypothetical protein